MKTKNIITILILFLFLVVAYLMLSGLLPLNSERKNVVTISEYSNLSPDIFYKPQPVELEFMAEEEKNMLNIAVLPTEKIQVVKRGQTGNSMVYRIIRSDSDILTEY